MQTDTCCDHLSVVHLGLQQFKSIEDVRELAHTARRLNGLWWEEKLGEGVHRPLHGVAREARDRVQSRCNQVSASGKACKVSLEELEYFYQNMNSPTSFSCSQES